MKKVLSIFLFAVLLVSLCSYDKEKDYTGTITGNGKSYNIVHNKIAFADATLPYDLMLGLIYLGDSCVADFVEEDIVRSKDYAAMLMQWNEAVNAHDVSQISKSYFADVIKYYGAYCDREDIEERYQALFLKYPQYKQQISNIEIDVQLSQITFDKTVQTAPDAAPKRYRMYLYFYRNFDEILQKDTSMSIICESDPIIDWQLRKKQATCRTARLNIHGTLQQLLPDNVGKKLEFSMGDFWKDFDDNPDTLLLSKIEFDTGSDMFEGIVRKHYKDKRQIYYCDGYSGGASVDMYHQYCCRHRIWKYDVAKGKVVSFAY